MDFPTLGLNFDLNDLIQGLRRLGEAKDGFKDVGRAAEKAGDDVADAGRKMTEASLAAEAAAFKTARSQKTEEDAIRSKVRQMRDLERVMNDIESAERLQRRIQTSGSSVDVDRSLIQSRMRLNAQQAAEAKRLADEVGKAQVAADLASRRQAEQTFAFRLRMARQQAAESASAEREAASLEARLAKEVATAQMQADRQAQAEAKNTFDFRMRMTRQRIQEEANAAREIAAAGRAAAQQTAADARAAEQVLQLRMRLTRQQAQEAAQAAEGERRGWARVADAIKMAADQTVRAATTDAEARVRITQAEIAQTRQSALTQESLTREAMLVDRLTKEVNELAVARSNAARQSAPAGSNADLVGAAAAAGTGSISANAQKSLAARQAQLAENQARDTGRRGIVAYIASLLGLGTAYDDARNRQNLFGSGIGKLNLSLAALRRFAFDARFAVAALLGAITLGPLAAMADSMVALESRTRLYAKRASDVPILLEATYQTAQRARQPLDGIATLYTRLAPLADQLGRSQMQLLRITETVAKAFTIGGSAASEATASAQQFAQAISSNRFGGDELRSVAENAPVLLQAIAEGVNQINPALNLNAATFIKWAQAGNATADIMVRALEYAQPKIDAMFSSFPMTISQATSVIQNSLTKMIDEIDRRSGEAGMRLSTNIAMGLQSFAEFLTDPKTIDMAVKSIEVLKTVFGALGTAISLTASYFPTLTVAVAAYTAWAQRAAIATAWASAMRGLAAAALVTGINFTAAGGGLAIFSGASATASLAVARLGVALKAAMGFMAGPGGLLIALTTFAAGLNYVNSNIVSVEDTLTKLGDSMETNTNALQRAATFVETYGGNTEAAKKQLEQLNDAINASLGITDEQTRGLDRAGQAALQRAKLEQALTVALLRRAAAEQVALQTSLRRSAAMNRLVAMESSATAGFIGLGTDGLTPAGKQNVAAYRARAEQAKKDAEFQDSLAASMDPRVLNAAADGVAAMDLSVPAIGNGDGRGQPPDSKDKPTNGRGMAGAINSIAKLRAEVDGLNRQIEDLEVSPLSDVAAKIIAAGKEAAAARTAGKGNAFQDQARNLAMLKEEASIRLDLTRALVDQQRAAIGAGEASRVGLWADSDATRAMLAYYDGASRGSANYAAALAAQADAAVRGEKTQENLRIAQQFGVTSVSEIARAYKDALDAAGLLTEETSKYADALQQQAQDTLDAASAAIDLATALERQKQANQAILARRAEIDDLRQYAAALRDGAAAVDEYNRRRRVNEAIQAEGPGITTGIAAVDKVLATIQAIRVANDVALKDAADYNLNLAERTLEMQEQLRLAALTTRQRQLEAEAIALARAGGRTAANDNDRKNANDLLNANERSNLKTSIQDSMRDAFIQSGKLDFKPLGDALAKTVRQKIYDQLIAKPIGIVVNAVVDFVSKGLDKLLGSFLEMAGPWGQAAAVALALATMVLGREQIRDNRDYRQSAEETQGMQGTGTVLGDLKAQSQSLRRSMELVAQYQNRTLEYSSGMLRALRNIESGIGSLTGLIGRQLGIGGALDTSGLGLGVSANGPGLLTKILNPFAAILPGLFGKTTTTNLMDQGLQFGGQNLASILNGGINGQTYQDISRNTTKKFFGITYSNKTSYSTQTQALDAELSTQIGLVIRSLKDGAVEAANVLGIEGASALLDAMQINIGRISFKDMDADGIQSALNAVFGKVADDMAATVLPSILEFQKAGEGAFETLTRVARQYQVIDVSLSSIGMVFGQVGVASLAARERLINLVGGLDEFTDQAAFFAENFLTPQERLAPVQKRLTEEMKRLGLSGITTKDQFKQLVMGLDVSTESGATMYAALMDLAPAFAAVTEGADKVREQLTRIFEFAQGLLTSNLSPLSPQEKLAIEQREYEDLLRRSQAGDVNALEKLTDASSEYLTAAQKYFASSPEYAAIFDKVYQELIALSGTEVQDPVVTAIETSTQRLIDAINAGRGIDGGTLPDQPPIQNDPEVGFGRERADLVGITEGLAEVRDTIAALGEAVVASQTDGFGRVVQATAEAPNTRQLLAGGGVSQVRKQAA